MSTHEPAAHVVLLGNAADAPALRLAVDADGAILSRERLVPAAPCPAGPTARGRRTVVVVPGSEAPAEWLEIPANGGAPARAAARAMLRERLARDADAVHIALAADRGAGTACAVAVEAGAMDRWLGHAAALGLCPDALLPDHVALPPPDGEAAVVAVRDGDWLVRTAGRSFRAEPALAGLVLEGRARETVVDAADVEAMLARGAASASLNLLQDRYAPAGASRSGPRAWRRAVLLAALALASVPLLWAAEAVRHVVSARALEAGTADMVAAALPATVRGHAPVDAVRAAVARSQAHDAFPRAFGALAAGVGQSADSAIERLSWQAGAPLRASVLHRQPEATVALEAAAAASGLQLAVAGTRQADGGLATEVELVEAAP